MKMDDFTADLENATVDSILKFRDELINDFRIDSDIVELRVVLRSLILFVDKLRVDVENLKQKGD